MTDKKIEDIRIKGFVTKWCLSLHIPTQDIEDYIQEAWVAALQFDYSRQKIKAALDSYRNTNLRIREHEILIPDMDIFCSDDL